MKRFKMIARDHNSSPTQYRTWITFDEPDFTGNQYFGLKSGTTPFDHVVTDVILDDSIVADFNLPNPKKWIITERVLPYNIYDSQLAIIDGYAYLFGGGGSDKIFKATLDNPADWEDTGETLPSVLSNSQLAIVDGYIYLFGGNTVGGSDGYSTDHIYRAPLLNPLDWTDQGALLPNKVQDHQLVILNNNIYILGGRTDVMTVYDTILQASVSDPLSWSVASGTLNEPLYGSHVGVINDTIYLFGGFTSFTTPTANIYSADITNLNVWFLLSDKLPYPAFNGQFFTIGTKGYLIAPTNTTVSFNKVLQCNLSTPAVWGDTKFTVPGELNGSQLGIIGDRLFLFGGNANSVIYADEPTLEYQFTHPDVVAYGNTTRTLVQSTSRLDLFTVLGFAYWKTNYVM